MSLRFPGAEDPEQFWADIRSGARRTRTFSEAELAAAGIAEHEYRAADFVGVSGVFGGIEEFDAEFFGMSAREAALTDPQQRLLLQCCYHALEDGGYPHGGRVGVYASTGYRLHSLHSYLGNNVGRTARDEDWLAAKQAQNGNYADYAAAQVAYRLNLTGPAVNVATACSSSLVAVHQACQALLLEEVDLALAGASALHFPQVTGHRSVRGSTMSPSGVLRAFDAAADGTVAGNGVAAVLLKPLDAALADGDTVHAVILGSGVANDGAAKAGFAAPSAAGQRAAVLRAFDAAGVSADSIGYLEAHGTGTRKGDPIEFDGLSGAFRAHTGRTGFCALGSSKPRIGHTDSAAGMAGLITSVLVLRHGIVPPLANFTHPNPALDLAASPFYLPTEPLDWQAATPRRAGVHSVGMGGTNAHLLLEQPPEPNRDKATRVAPGLLPLSAADPDALTELAAALHEHLRRHQETGFADLVTTLALGRRRFTHRLAVPGRTVAELTEALEGYLRGAPDHGCRTGVADESHVDDASTDADLAELHCRGSEIDWAALLRGCGGRRIPLPHYPFRRTRHWVGRANPDLHPWRSHVHPDSTDQTEAAMPDQRTLDHVLELTARHLGYPAAEIDRERSLVDLGADSLQLIGLQLDLEAEFGVGVEMTELLDVAPTPRLLAALLDERKPAGPAAAEEAAEPVQPEPVQPEPVQQEPAQPEPVQPEPVQPEPARPEPARPQETAVTQHGPSITVAADSGMAAAAHTPEQQAHLAELTDRLAERTSTSKELTQRRRGVLADSRAAVGFRSATKETQYLLHARDARGARLTDVDGHSYVDITMGFGALLFGHEPEFVTEAVREHLAGGLRFGLRSADTGEAAALLAELTGAERVAFACTGTEANSAALRLARAATGRDRVVMFRGSYHGHVDSVLGRAGAEATVPVSPGIPASAVAELTVLEYGEQRSLEFIAEHAERIAAVLVEPVQCRNPELRPAEFVRSLRELTAARGIVLIFDEMLTGLRSHPRGAQHHYGVTADLTTYGKALGSGFPIGALAGRADILDGVDGGFWRYGDHSGPQRATVFFGGTHMQHPVSMAAARAVLGHLREQGPGLQEALGARTARLAAELNGFFAEQEFPLRLEHFGSMFRFRHRADMDLLYRHLLLRGVHVWEWRSFYLSTAHTDADVAWIADAVKDSLRELRGAGFLPEKKAAPAPARSPQQALDFSVYFFGDTAPGESSRDSTKDSTGKYDLMLDTARFADKHGFHAVWLPERHFHSFGGLFPNPSVLAAAVAGTTEQIRINAGSVVLPLHDPIRIAEEWSVVDNLSGGRVGLGFGTGWHAQDFVLAPENFERRKEIGLEHLADLRRLWAGEPVRRRCGSGAEIDVRVHPRPVQAEPPMWLATTGRAASFEQAGRLGFGVLTNLMNQTVEQLAEHIGHYRRGRTAAGLDADGGRVTVLLHTYLADDHATARAEALEPMVGYLRSSLLMRSAAEVSGRSAADLAAASQDDLDTLFRRAYDRYCDQRALIGTPRSCAPLLRRLRAAGVSEVAALVDFGMAAAQVADGLLRLDRLRREHRAEPAASVEPAAPASPAQRRIWLAAQLTGARAYNEVQAVRLRGPLDTDALASAIELLVARHPGLRITFQVRGAELHQVLSAQTGTTLSTKDCDGHDPDTAIAAAIRAESEREPDTERGPLLHPRLLRFGREDHALVFGIHHLITDGHSAGIIATDLAECYRAAARGETARFDSPGGDPLLATPPAAEAADLTWWRGHLGSEPPVPRQPTDRPRTDAATGSGGSVSAWFSAERTAAVREWSAAQGVTPFATMLTAWRVVLRRFSGQDDCVIGSTFGRRRQDTTHTVGFFSTLLPIRGVLREDTELRTAVRAARETLRAAAEHQWVDTDALYAEFNPAPGAARGLLPVSIDLGTDALASMDLPGVRAEPVGTGTTSAPLELSMMVVRAGAATRLTVRYDAALFDEATAHGYLEQFQLVLDGMAAGTANTVAELPTLTDAQVTRLAELGEATPVEHAAAEVVQPRQDGVLPAVIDAGTSHDGASLRAASGAVAARLAELGVHRGDVVAVALPRGHDFLAAVLGVLAAGAAYLPLDLNQPAPRLAAMLSDAAPAALCAAPDLDPALAPGVPRFAVAPDRSAYPEVTAPRPDDPLCLLYTSGSTGTPKGVLLEHRNVAATLAVFTDRLRLTAADRLSWYSAPGFDAGHIEFLAAVRSGAALHVVPEQLRVDSAALVAWLVAERITVAFLPTAVAEQVLAEPWPTDTALRVLCVGGERMNVRPPAGLPFAVRNIYGPTECSVFCTWTEVSSGGAGSPALGGPNPGLRLAVRDPAGRLLPPGAIGELHVGGPQVAHGYHRDEALTVDRFRTDGDGIRWYRTGDLVRWRGDGELDFCGRADDQVQIRGMRVEPAEVAHAVRALPGVRDARVRAEPDQQTGRDQLACYVLADGAATSGNGQTEQARRWREALAESLPRPMVPQRWLVVDELPLTTNGKWAANGHSDEPDQRARIEDLVRSAWQDVLGVEEFDDDARFFDLGGHSLNALTMLNRVRAELACDYSLTAFFAEPTVRAMVSTLDAAPRAEEATERVRGEL